MGTDEPNLATCRETETWMKTQKNMNKVNSSWYKASERKHSTERQKYRKREREKDRKIERQKDR